MIKVFLYGGMSVDWKEVARISDIESIDTGVYKKIDENTIKKEYDWTELYGELVERRI